MQDGNKYAPFQTFSDAAFAKRTVEDGIGKAKRQRLLDTIRHPDFKPEEMVVTSEKRRDAVMQQFPGVQRRLPDVWQIPVIFHHFRVCFRPSLTSTWRNQETNVSLTPTAKRLQTLWTLCVSSSVM